MEDLITIPKSTYERLLRDQTLLDCLKGAGVDNWSGYDDAMEMFAESEDA
ncbi:hypothetical protein RJP21_04850 [Paenibacillus sp. VCA1]|nr:hypothetical protein [Paenibacillus sp. VCA1]MDR9852929.1 hypothetical protein [Paenibacillus sp. VCA1]